MTICARPGAEGSLMSFQPRYDNYIGGEWVAPVQGRYFENATPVSGHGLQADRRRTSPLAGRSV